MNIQALREQHVPGNAPPTRPPPTKERSASTLKLKGKDKKGELEEPSSLSLSLVPSLPSLPSGMGMVVQQGQQLGPAFAPGTRLLCDFWENSTKLVIAIDVAGTELEKLDIYITRFSGMEVVFPVLTVCSYNYSKTGSIRREVLQVQVQAYPNYSIRRNESLPDSERTDSFTMRRSTAHEKGLPPCWHGVPATRQTSRDRWKHYLRRLAVNSFLLARKPRSLVVCSICIFKCEILLDLPHALTLRMFSKTETLQILFGSCISFRKMCSGLGSTGESVAV
jgi:hypothetical protein